VQRRIGELGEGVTPGVPVMSIVDPQHVWVRFNLPEDLLSEVRMGTNLRVRVPALGNQEVPVRVDSISPNAGFAIRRVASGTGDSVLRIFEVRAVPIQITEGLRPGMSAVLTWRKCN